MNYSIYIGVDHEVKQINMKHRYHIDTNGNDYEACIEMFRFAVKSAQEDENITDIVILNSTLKATGYIKRLFNSDTVKKLPTGISIKECNAQIKFTSEQLFKRDHSFNSKKIVVLFGASLDRIRIAEDNPEV